MKTTFVYTYLILFFHASLFAQNSVHLLDKLSHENIIKRAKQSHLTITNSTNSLTKSVFGFLPYWELESSVIRLDLLSHIALFDFVLNEDGSLTPPYNWPDSWATIINFAQANNVKVLATISNLTEEAVDSVLISTLINSNTVQANFFNDVKHVISTHNLDGVILDFENLKLSERGDPINNFVSEIRDSLDLWFSGKELSFATPAVNWGSRWKLKELSEICDYLFIMAYDYHGSWSTNAGPVAPLNGNNNYNQHNYRTTIEDDYSEVNPVKIILGVPYYGAQWQIENNNIYTEVDSANWVSHVDYSDIDWATFKNSINFDDISQTTYLLSQIDNDYNLLWIDTDTSLELKYDFALKNNLKGLGIWSLGKDGNYPELWNLIEEKFTDTTLTVGDEEIVNDFILYQNYPNPFNPSTTISFTIPTSPSFPLLSKERDERVRLVVYDLLGREVATLLNQKLEPGNYQIKFNANGLSGGFYTYQIYVFGKFSESKKMLLLK